jgi:hypothetical protein
MRYPHWQFFESIDDELLSLSRIIEFAPENFSTFSVHLARLYLSLGSEIDVVAKLLCNKIAPTEKPESIKAYCPLITNRYSHFTQLRIELPAHGLDFQPWASWSQALSPRWWTDYNKVKHERNRHFSQANVGNVLEAAAGLIVLLVYYHQEELYSNTASIQPDFKIMRIDRKHASIMRWGFDYSLPDFGKNSFVK